MPSLILETSLSPDDVMQRLDERAAEWRESRLPPAMRKRGVFGVRVWRTGTKFRMYFLGGRGRYVPALIGEVEHQADGRTRIRTHFGASRYTSFANAFFAAMLVAWLWWGSLSAITLIMTAVGVGFWALFHAMANGERQALLDMLGDLATQPVKPNAGDSVAGN